MKQKLARAFWRRDFVAGLCVRLDVGVVEESFAFLDAGKSIADICLTGTDRFDLAALQLDAGFIALENVKIAQRLAIKNRFGGHARAEPRRRSRRRLSRS